MATAIPISPSTLERRDFVKRAEVMHRVVESLCSGDTANNGLPADIVTRILRHLALKGMARLVGDVWSPTPLLTTRQLTSDD
jgi:hypothetical protein